MAVLALPSSFTWGLFRRVPDTAILRPQAPAELRVEPPTTLKDEEPQKQPCSCHQYALIGVSHHDTPDAPTLPGPRPQRAPAAARNSGFAMSFPLLGAR